MIIQYIWKIFRMDGYSYSELLLRPVFRRFEANEWTDTE